MQSAELYDLYNNVELYDLYAATHRKGRQRPTYSMMIR